MTITSALSNALSGLTANARAAGVVSANLANIQTDGYGRREINLSQDRYGLGGGVRVTGVTRHVDAGVLADRRIADSDMAHSETRAQFLQQVQSSIGTPDQPGSLSARIAALEASLVTAASRPDESSRLQNVAQRATEMTQGFNGIAADIAAARTNAERDISAAVNSLNADLGHVRDINIQIQDAQRHGADSSALLDHRQVVVDRIASLVPVREIPRDNGAIALMTPGGALLIDGPSATLEFTRTNVVAPHMTLENGLLSGLTINGEQVPPAGMRSPIAGGRLSALFEIRDTLTVETQRQVDALARDMIERFEGAALDTTRAPTDPGLFTDAGGLLNPADEFGLAGRIALNASVDPAAGGAVWRLRDGLGATVPGPAGDATLLTRIADALSGDRLMASGDLGSGAGSAAQHVAAMVSQLAQGVLAEDRTTSFAAVRQAGLQERLLSDGVNSDEETARLLLIEQSYSANARMIQTLDEMMQTLLRI